MTKVKIPLLRILTKLFGKKYVFAGVPVIIQNSKKEILLGKRSSNHPFYPSLWGLPGGMIEYGEKMEEAAKREIYEEIGVKIEIMKQLKPRENFPNKSCRIHTVDIPHLAKIIKGVPKPKDETSEVKWFKPLEIKKMKLAYNHKEILEKEGCLK